MSPIGPISPMSPIGPIGPIGPMSPACPIPMKYIIYHLLFIIYHFEFRRIFNISIFNVPSLAPTGEAGLFIHSTTIVGLFRSGSDITYRYVGRMVRLML